MELSAIWRVARPSDSPRCDALAVIVSESAAISLAVRGKLYRHLTTAPERAARRRSCLALGADGA